MIGRFWKWIVGNQKVEINVNINIKDVEKLIKVLSQSQSNPVIIQERSTERIDTFKSEQRQGKRKLAEDPLTSQEVANIMLSDGIEKATDKTGNDIVSSSEGGSTDDTVSSLKKMFKGDRKDG